MPAMATWLLLHCTLSLHTASADALRPAAKHWLGLHASCDCGAFFLCQYRPHAMPEYGQLALKWS